MKKILITGANSYIGKSFSEYISQFGDDYVVDTVDMLNDDWKNMSFSDYDSVFNVAGIAHIKETKDNSDLYYKVNKDLTFAVAQKAKTDGVKQFIFLSSMSVYGKDVGEITKSTVTKPNSHYGKSKLEAEELLSQLQDDTFKVAVLRPPMVYGKGCKGNFQLIIKIIKKTPLFPKINNKRSMLYINNLCEFVKIIADDNLSGLYFPQNNDYMCTSDIAKIIAETYSKKVYISRLAGLFVCILFPFSRTVKKSFGTLIYKDTEDFNFSYCKTESDKSIKESV